MDEVTSKACVDGTYADDAYERACMRLNPGYYPSTKAYSTAAQRGLLVVDECAWPPARGLDQKDGICAARLVKRYAAG